MYGTLFFSHIFLKLIEKCHSKGNENKIIFLLQKIILFHIIIYILKQ
jgi:hypothetical protein